MAAAQTGGASELTVTPGAAIPALAAVCSPVKWKWLYQWSQSLFLSLSHEKWILEKESGDNSLQVTSACDLGTRD